MARPAHDSLSRRERRFRFPASPINAITCSSPLRLISAFFGNTPRSGSKNNPRVCLATASVEPVVSTIVFITELRFAGSRINVNAAPSART